MPSHADTDERANPLARFHPAVRAWFGGSFDAPTQPQSLGWPAIARGDSTLILAPTGSGKTLTAFLWCLNRLMFEPVPAALDRCRVVYISPLKALAADVERNLQAPLAGIAAAAAGRADPHLVPSIAIRTGDTPASERARFQRHPSDILITTPESLYLLLTSNARRALTAVHTIIVDEIHALVPTKRGAHLAVSIERLAARCAQPPQRIGLSATQRPLEEVARFLGGARASHVTRGSPPPRTASPAGGSRDRPAAPAADVDRLTAALTSELDADAARHVSVSYRPVTIVDAGSRKALQLSIEVPVEDMRQLTTADEIPSGPASVGDTRPSIWSAIHPRLIELIRAHRSTLIFVNSRRLAERLAGALNEIAGETLVRSHHGSIARPQRLEVEERLKAGDLRALVATSSLELGIDMGAIDLVVQIEAPPSVASGLQRIGRGGHTIGAVSSGVVFPKFRGDLLACAAVTRAMHDGAVEATRYPRNPLDIAAQQIVAMASMDTWPADDLFDTLRRAAPFAELTRAAFDGVLDMLSGRYPSDEFADLRPRLTWNRGAGTIVAREGAKQVAIANGGTIPDRGLFGVFLLGAGPGAARVGELDEEMVFESHPGETFVLGATSWRIEEITHDRVLVSPAPGEPGKMPFWRGDRAGRPLELGLAIGDLTRDLLRMPPAAAATRLTREHDLDARAAENLLQYLRDQLAATRAVPDAGTILVERVRDELGDWRICVLSPRGGRIHAPWAMAAAAKIRDRTGMLVDTLWGDDGFVVRFPGVDEPPDPALLLPDAEEAQSLVVRQLGATALFAAKFRENAARSLLLPKRRPGMRAPLWQQRKRAADLMAVAARYGSFPVLLETYRECLRDYFDMPALVSTLGDIGRRRIRVVTVDSEKPSPFAGSLLFSYVASFLYDGDAPLAERRAQALSVDQSQLRDLIGDAELRELLDAGSIAEVERQLQRLDVKNQARSPDGLHDMLLAVGDLSDAEIGPRTTDAKASFVGPLVEAGRAVPLTIGSERRYVAVEDAVRYRDALGIALPSGIPASLLQTVEDPIGDLARRYGRTHGPFTTTDFAARYALPPGEAEAVLARLTGEHRLLEGEFRPGGTQREWIEPSVLRMIRRRSLARLRREIEPVDQPVLARFAAAWQGIVHRRRGVDALLDVVEQLQGAPLAASILETEILPARLDNYDPGDMDAVMAAGEVVWVGVEALGDRDGRVALYLTDDLPRLLPPQDDLTGNKRPASTKRHAPRSARHERSAGSDTAPAIDPKGEAILECLGAQGASFFQALHETVGGGYPAETVDTVWALVWRGLVTNDALHALRAYTRVRAPRRRARRPEGPTFRSRRQVPPMAEGRWSLVRGGPGGLGNTRDCSAHGAAQDPGPSARTAWAAAFTRQLLNRHGVVTREAMAAESVPGGFGAIYPVLKAMEEGGRLRRGYFVAGLGATQFALPAAIDRLRALRDADDVDAHGTAAALLAATDPANVYGATLKWPSAGPSASGRGATRTVGASVILVGGQLAAYLARGDRQILTWLPDAEPQRTTFARSVARALIDRARSTPGTEGSAPATGDPRDVPAMLGMLIEEVDGIPPHQHPLAPFLIQAGFTAGAMGFAPTRPPKP